MAYTIETIIAEKFESIISKNITTTRAKDFYDLYMLMNNKNDINNKNLVKAIQNTFNKRNTDFDIDNFKEIIELLSDSKTLKRVFTDYQEKLVYTKQVKFDDTINAIREVIKILESELVVIQNIMKKI